MHLLSINITKNTRIFLKLCTPTQLLFIIFKLSKFKQAFNGFLEALREEYGWLYESMHAEDLATAPAASSSAVVSNRASPSRVAAQALAQPSGIRNKKLG